ncbi:MAG: hypothetical protein QF629_08920 [Alphaproteobacteria bacterium]|nr:hypothetical protein [Alphaproteobacteria bacterium]MDP7173014.1 hypothetical protein [Alphaproteobacteria bacterium]
MCLREKGISEELFERFITRNDILFVKPAMASPTDTTPPTVERIFAEFLD